ncbi:virulence-associated protein E [Nostoc phage YongM]|nr:virulence-associated protein E [Nostoc phage YongM]
MSTTNDQKKLSGVSRTEQTKKEQSIEKTFNETIITDSKEFVNFLFLQHAVQLTPGVTKDGLRSAFKMNRNDWKRRKGLEIFIESIQSGYIHQAEITINGEKQYHFGVIDFDFWNKAIAAPIEHTITIEQIKQLPSIKKYCYAIQKSISYRENAQNCHGYLIFDNPILSKEDFQKCLKAVVELVKRDIATVLGLEYHEKLELGVDGCTANNPSQVTFASLEPVTVMGAIATVETLLKISNFFEIKVSKSAAKSPESLPKTEQLPTVDQSTNQGLTVTDKVLKHLHDNLFVPVFNSDAGLLYSLHDENQRWTPRTDLEAGEVCRLEGFNPFSGTNNSGSSFMLIHIDGELPRFWDKSGSFERVLKDGYSSNHGTFLDYYFHIKRDEFPNIELEDGQFPKGFFRTLVDHIINYFGIDSFDWENGKTEFSVVIGNCLTHLKKYVKHLGNDTWFMFDRNVWSIVYDFSHIYCKLGKPWIIENYGDEVFIRKGKQILTVTKDDAKYKPELMRLLKDDRTYQYEELPKENFRYVPALNGLWDLRDRKLVENNGQAYNFFKFPYNVSPESQKRGEDASKQLLQYFTELFESSIYATVVYNYFLLHCRREAFDAEILPCIIGASGKGKTTVLMLLKKLINGIDENTWHEQKRTPNSIGFCGQPNRDDLVSGYTHGTENLEGKSCIVIPEITNNVSHVGKDTMSFFKAFAGNKSDNTLKINPKGKKARERQHKLGFFLDNEKMPDINSSIAGNFRRLFFIEMKETSPGSDPFHQKWMNIIEPQLEDIFNYALTLDSRKLIGEIKELHKNKIVTDLVALVRETNDSVLEFVRDFIEVTNDEKDIVSLDAIYKVFENENHNGKYASRSLKKRLLINQIIERLKDKAYALGWAGEQTSTEIVSRCKIINKSVRGFLTGVRLTENALLAIGRHDLAALISDHSQKVEDVNTNLEITIDKDIETPPESERETAIAVNDDIKHKIVEVIENGVTVEKDVLSFVRDFQGDEKQLLIIISKLNAGKNHLTRLLKVKFVNRADQYIDM